jgi:uncharacterized damage-inducible protein DinB
MGRNICLADVVSGVVGMKAHFERMARYNRWANRRIYGVVAQLEPEEIQAPRSGFFPSIAKTLNHLLVTDRIWIGRFTNKLSDHKSLDEAPYDDFAALTAAREAEDQRLIALTKDLSQAQIEGVLNYKNMAGEPKSSEMLPLLAHLFNHQTHHRGQAHAMISSTRVAPPPLDLVYFIYEDKEA